MSKRKAVLVDKESFGERMARFRQAAGFLQRDLAAVRRVKPTKYI